MKKCAACMWMHMALDLFALLFLEHAFSVFIHGQEVQYNSDGS